MKELQTGWLSPSGDFYPCRVYEHISLARKILNDENANRADEKLQDSGFAEITLSQIGVKEWRVYWKHFLTEQQKNFLKPYFEDDTFPMGNIVKMRWEVADKIEELENKLAELQDHPTEKGGVQE